MNPDRATTNAVEATLARYAELVRAAMATFLPNAEPAAYLYDLVRDYPRRGGKAVRPALLLATCGALGGTQRAGLAPAVALELLHNAFLVHDDVEDGALRRRGGSTLHELHGIGLAINAGDALACLALQPIRADPVLGPRLARLLLTELTTVVRQTTEGQALELGWRRHGVFDLAVEDYLAMAAKKTCWYSTVAPLRMGALVGTRATARHAALTRFGLHLGAAFQIRDDLLDLDGAESGKDVYADLRRGKPTLMLIHLLSRARPADRAWLGEQLAAGDVDVDELRELMDRHGSVAFAHDYATGITAAAHTAFDEAFGGLPATEHLIFLRELIPYMLDRRA